MYVPARENVGSVPTDEIDELVEAYSAIKNAELRKTLLDLLKQIATEG